jgi:hypothetical protein
MSEQVYLIVEDLTKKVDIGIIYLFNARHVGLGTLKEGDTYQDMRNLKELLKPVKGSGYDKIKNGVKHWVLPFEPHIQMGNFPDVTVLTLSEFYSYGWDIIEIEL